MIAFHFASIFIIGKPVVYCESAIFLMIVFLSLPLMFHHVRSRFLGLLIYLFVFASHLVMEELVFM